MTRLQQAVISLGSNVPQGKEILTETLHWLRSFMTDVTESGIYTTEALNGSGTYFNLVIKGQTALSAEAFEEMAKRREAEAGRVKSSDTIPLDIDLVALGSNVVRPAELCRLYFLQGFEIVSR